MIFWNVERLGKGTDFDGIATVINTYTKDAPQTVILCEVVNDVSYSQGELAKQEIDLFKQVTVPKRGKKLASAQLGYACADVRHGHWVDRSLERCDIGDFDAVYAHVAATPPKGGTRFMDQSKRFVVYVGKIRPAGSARDVALFAYHANSSAKAELVVHWAAAYLREVGPFVLVGDLNCEPLDLSTYNGKFGASFGLTAHWGGNTHNAYSGASKIYDWLLAYECNASVKVLDYVTDKVLDGYVADHLPIYFDISAKK
jgi:hypothetical protein